MVRTRTTVGELASLIPSFERSLRAQRKSPKTIKAYGEAARQLAVFLHANGMPTAAANVKREHVESFIEDQLAKWKPTTANQRFRSLQQFFKWLEDEGEVAASPMLRMRAPKLDD